MRSRDELGLAELGQLGTATTAQNEKEVELSPIGTFTTSTTLAGTPPLEATEQKCITSIRSSYKHNSHYDR